MRNKIRITLSGALGFMELLAILTFLSAQAHLEYLADFYTRTLLFFMLSVFAYLFLGLILKKK